MHVTDRPVETMPPARAIGDRHIYTVAFLLFGCAAAITLYFLRSMRRGMLMPGDWTMSMMWMRMPDQEWIEAALVFLGMWVAMMVAMMLPSTLPMLLLYRRTLLAREEPHRDWLMWTAAAGYFLVWSLFGVAVYVLGLLLAQSAMTWPTISRAMPLLAGAALIFSGVYQLTPWKFACLRHCRNPIFALVHYQQQVSGRRWAAAFHLGLHHGAFCAACCWALMLIQLCLGVMSLTAMVAVAGIIAFEKLIARGALVARAVGIAAITGGAIVVLHAL